MKEKIKIEEIIKEAKASGWVERPLGFYRSSGVLKPKKGFRVLERTAKFGDFLKKYAKNEVSGIAENVEISAKTAYGVKPAIESPEEELTPSTPVPAKARNSADLPLLGNFGSYDSLKVLRAEKPTVLIGYDSEWVQLPSTREMISWQFAVIWDGMLREVVFIRDGDEDLDFDLALGILLDMLAIKPIDARKVVKYKYCPAWNDDLNEPIIESTDKASEAKVKAVYISRHGVFYPELISDQQTAPGKDGWLPYYKEYDYSEVEKINVCLVCHTGKADLTALHYYDGNSVLRHLTEVQGGLVTMTPFRRNIRSSNKNGHEYLYPLTIHVRDTLAFAPSEKKKLEDLGAILGIPKIHLEDEIKVNMLAFLQNSPVAYLEYASRDSVVTMLYCSAIFGYNNLPPVTLTSAAASAMKESIMTYLNCKKTSDYNFIYRGLKKVSHGLTARTDKAGFIEESSLEPVSADADLVQRFASNAFHGGYNSCSEVGNFNCPTYDYDLKNAYPTAMAAVPDIDWKSPILEELRDEDMDFDTYGSTPIEVMSLFVGYIRFSFPENVIYPCIPITVDGVPVYPRSSDGIDGVYVAGSFIALALRLGAKIHCVRGFFLRPLLREDGTQSRSLSAAVLQLVRDRAAAKKKEGKGSLVELTLKMMVSSGYGKIAQNVVQKSTWSAHKDAMENIGCSAITNPVSAMMTTSLIQCVLLAAQNELEKLGHRSYSVTTDGMISSASEKEVKSLQLFGFRPIMEQARLFLTDGTDPEIWEIKHAQDQVLNFSTRGNVSLSLDGVCAHNNVRAPKELVLDNGERVEIKKNDLNDRLWLTKAVLSREGKVKSTFDKWSLFKDLVAGRPFVIKEGCVNKSMDFDLKRKPDRSSFTTDYQCIDGQTYETAHFRTLPYNNIAEFKIYREKAKLVPVLRTEADWKAYFLKVDTNGKSLNIGDGEWKILTSCVMGHRTGLWTIPGLVNGTVTEKIAFINAHNTSSKKFKESNWKNACRPERFSGMLPVEFLKDKLDELGAIFPEE